MGALSITGQPSKRAPFEPLIPGARFATPETLAEHVGPQTAAIFLEPVQGEGGVHPLSTEVLARARALADEHGAMLIFDEVQTSRLAFGGRQSQLGITPDLTTIGKFFGGGLAFGCFGGDAKIMQQFDPRRPDALGHAGTFNNNTLTMAAGIAAVTKLLTAENLDAVNARGEKLRADINTLFEARQAPYRVKGLGSLMNIHPTVAAPGEADLLRKLLFFELNERGVYMAMRGLIALSFPIGDAETQALLAALDELLEARGPIGRAS